MHSLQILEETLKVSLFATRVESSSNQFLHLFQKSIKVSFIVVSVEQTELFNKDGYG
jgi:hypothetical protein